MGYTSLQADGRTANQILTAEFTQSANRADGSIQTEWAIMTSSTRGREWYGVIRTKNGGDGFERFFIMVCLWSIKNGEFSYKAMADDEQPYCYNCPRRILDLIDKVAPNPEPRAAEWRINCRVRLSEKNTLKPCAGMHISYGAVIYQLIASAGARRGWIVQHGSGKQYRIPARAMSRAVQV